MFLEPFSLGAGQRLVVKRPIGFVSFNYLAPRAKFVCLAGDFNGWDRVANPMKRLPDGGWTIKLPLHNGHHQYYFVVDGLPTLDPRSAGTVSNERGEIASLVAVS